MFPLLKRVDLQIPYAVLTLLWAYLLGLPPTSMSAYVQGSHNTWFQLGTSVVHCGFYLAMGVWHFLELFILPPTDKPDLWTVVNVGIGAAGFSLCYLWCLGILISESGILSRKEKPKAKTQ